MSRVERYEGPRDNTPHDEANCPYCQEDIAAMTTLTTPAQVRPELAGAWQKVQSAITFGWHKQLESFEARALAEEHDALQSQLSNEQLVAQHYKESCDILRERAEAAQQAVAEREARLALAVEALESLLHEDGGSLAHSANHPKCAAARAVIAACKEACMVALWGVGDAPLVMMGASDIKKSLPARPQGEP